MPKYEVDYEYVEYDVAEFFDEDDEPYEDEVEEYFQDYIVVEAESKSDAQDKAYAALRAGYEGVSVLDVRLVEDD
jgi:hypothetical protein